MVVTEALFKTLGLKKQGDVWSGNVKLNVKRRFFVWGAKQKFAFRKVLCCVSSSEKLDGLRGMVGFDFEQLKLTNKTLSGC